MSKKQYRWECKTCGGQSPAELKPNNCGADAGCLWVPINTEPNKYWDNLLEVIVTAKGSDKK
jgi:hypothetical protein